MWRNLRSRITMLVAQCQNTGEKEPTWLVKIFVKGLIILLLISSAWQRHADDQNRNSLGNSVEKHFRPQRGGGGVCISRFNIIVAYLCSHLDQGYLQIYQDINKFNIVYHRWWSFNYDFFRFNLKFTNTRLTWSRRKYQEKDSTEEKGEICKKFIKYVFSFFWNLENYIALKSLIFLLIGWIIGSTRIRRKHIFRGYIYADTNMAGNEVPFTGSLTTQGNMQQTLPLQNVPKADVSDKQTLLAVLQFLKKNNLKVYG